MDIRKRFGKRVKALRGARGWSQEELADRAGMHRTYISAVERAVRNPTLTVMDRIAKALGLSLSELFDEIR